MRIVLSTIESLTSRGVRSHLMDGYKYYYTVSDSATHSGVRQQGTTNLLEVIKRKKISTYG